MACAIVVVMIQNTNNKGTLDIVISKCGKPKHQDVCHYLYTYIYNYITVDNSEINYEKG